MTTAPKKGTENMDLVYILGKGSHWSDNELRFSIRSAIQNLKFRKIFIVGEYPEWLRKAQHVPAPDKSSNKIMNAIAKYKVICADKRISDDFILMNDDFFILKPVKTIPYFSRGTLQEMIERHKSKTGYYYFSLTNTRFKLASMGIDEATDYEIHAPIIFNKEKLKNVIGTVGEDKAYCFRTCYGSILNLKPKKEIDFKAASLIEFAYQMKREPAYLSISDALVATKEFREYIQRKFKTPSEYELDGGAGSDAAPGASIQSMRYYAKKAFSYGMHEYQAGEVLQQEHIKPLKKNKKMAHLWVRR